MKKIKMQVVFKSGGSLAGETYEEDFKEFVNSINLADESKTFKIFDVEEAKNHCILLKLSEVNAFVLEEEEEVKSVAQSDFDDSNR